MVGATRITVMDTLITVTVVATVAAEAIIQDIRLNLYTQETQIITAMEEEQLLVHQVLQDQLMVEMQIRQ